MKLLPHVNTPLLELAVQFNHALGTEGVIGFFLSLLLLQALVCVLCASLKIIHSWNERRKEERKDRYKDYTQSKRGKNEI